MESITPILEFKKTCVSYTKQTMAVKYVSATIEKNTITAIMGPSGCGKSTLLRAVNLMHNLYPNIRVDGEILLNGENILSMEPIDVRRRVGMVFQTPQVFPASIRRNMFLPLSIVAGAPRSELEDRMRDALQQVELWDEVADRLDASAEGLSGGQQQRLCLARALALEPEILLLDEPSASLDVHAARHVEELIASLAGHCTVVLVSHSLGQSLRLASTLAVMGGGHLLYHTDNPSELSRKDLEELLAEGEE